MLTGLGRSRFDLEMIGGDGSSPEQSFAGTGFAKNRPVQDSAGYNCEWLIRKEKALYKSRTIYHLHLETNMGAQMVTS